MKFTSSQVIVKDEDTASGLAWMIHDLLCENLNAFRIKAFLSSHVNGTVNLVTVDKNRSISITFSYGSILIDDGVKTQGPTLYSNWKLFASISSGLSSPVAAYLNRELKIEVDSSFLKNYALAAACGYILSVPNSFYEKNADESESKEKKRLVVRKIMLTAIFVLILIYVLKLKRHSDNLTTRESQIIDLPSLSRTKINRAKFNRAVNNRTNEKRFFKTKKEKL